MGNKLDKSDKLIAKFWLEQNFIVELFKYVENKRGYYHFDDVCGVGSTII